MPVRARSALSWHIEIVFLFRATKLTLVQQRPRYCVEWENRLRILKGGVSLKKKRIVHPTNGAKEI